MALYDVEIEVPLTPEEEAYLAGIDGEADESGEVEDEEPEEEVDPWGEAAYGTCRHCGTAYEDGEDVDHEAVDMSDLSAVDMSAPTLEAHIFDHDEIYQADEHALHDEKADGTDEELSGAVAAGEEETLAERVQAALRQGFWAVAIRLMIMAGERDENRLANLIFQARHPELAGRRIRPDEKQLAAEWRAVRDQIVRPLLPAGTGGGRRPPFLSEGAIRTAWRHYENAKHRMTTLRMFGRWNTPVNPETVDAWKALERALKGAGYDVHRAWVFEPRKIGTTTTPSLHAYGLAIDIDHGRIDPKQPIKCNLNRKTPDKRRVRFSTAPTKQERCRDVHRGVADTSFTPDQVAAVEAIRTVDGYQVFTWGGRWKTKKDTMHFQINVTPEELRRGLA